MIIQLFYLNVFCNSLYESSTHTLLFYFLKTTGKLLAHSLFDKMSKRSFTFHFLTIEEISTLLPTSWLGGNSLSASRGESTCLSFSSLITFSSILLSIS